MSPSLDTYIVGPVIFSPTPRRSDSGIARYQLRAAVSTPGSATARASRSAASEGGLAFDCMNVDSLEAFPSLSRKYRSGMQGKWKK